ncbi:endoglucanase [Methanobrevibacter sp.]|uniref:endoglucanase n=1 Tax=Methanobrevibacter sp. TaxID=66852 RepID=UPI0025F7C2DE|nr:endoglucanase [Methanobrevibacter sp.]MBR4447293.1 endoglucanase [Methanobrevibacter sp.]
MDKANIIISIIIVLCIAAAVAAYGITNSENPIFSDLSSMGASDDTGNQNGIGNNTVTTEPNSVATTSGSSGSTGSGSGSGSSSGSSSSSSSSSDSSSNSGNSNSGTSNSPQLSYNQAQSIASSAILEEGCYAKDGYYSNGYWIFTVYDADGNVVDTIGVNDATGMTERV